MNHHSLTYSKRILGSLTALFALSSQAYASFLDTDFFCRNFGCVVVADGRNVDIYDNWRFSSNSCCVAFGEAMIPFTLNVNTLNTTGTLDSIAGTNPTDIESFQLGITQDGTNITQSVFDDGDGFLDASDSLAKFSLNSATDIKLDGSGREYSHSFFITSRNTRFSLRARASLAQATGDFAGNLTLGDIGLTPSIQSAGNDGGFNFGSRADTSQVTLINAVDDLGDLSGASTQIMEFGRNAGIRLGNGDIDQQTIRLDFLYSMPDYDLSLGVGSLDIDVIFDFHREP